MWFLIALLNPLFHSLINHLDKYLLGSYLKKYLGENYNPTGALILLSALFSIVLLPFLFLFNKDVFSIELWRALLLMINGALLVTAIICYLNALSHDDAEVVAPLFQLIPVFGLFLGYSILHEALRVSEMIAVIMIVVGGGLLSLKIGSKKVSIKRRLILLMVGSSFCYALNATIFKFIAINQGFMDSLFWDMAGKFVFGIFLFFCVAQYRKSFLAIIKTKNPKIFALNIGNEIFAIIGEVALILALMYAPIALVQSVGGLQPLFVLIIGFILRSLFPKLKIDTWALKGNTQKFVEVFGIIIITAGGILLVLN